MPPQENPTSAAYRPCANCGDLLPPGVPRCPHCGASQAPGHDKGNPALLVVKIIVAVVVSLFVLPLAACGACFTFLGFASMQNAGHQTSSDAAFPLMGIAMMAAAVGGIVLIIFMFIPRGTRKK